MKRSPSKLRTRRLTLETLEKRDVPATWGMAWPQAQHLTASFVPDGTSIQGQSSQLFSKFDSQLGAGQWEATVLGALQTWAENASINIGQVADGGQPLGTAGPAQGDARFGDIRISAVPLPADVVAITAPYDPGTGTVSGDMIFNSNDDFSSASGYDLFTVALHEAGHVFGFADSSDPTSFMYDVYGGPQTGLKPGAIPALQALYGGPRDITDLDGESTSSDPTKPVDISNSLINPSTTPLVAGDLATPTDADYFQFKAPALAAASLGIDLQVQTAGISQLVPRITVTDAKGNVVTTATATSTISGASVHLATFIQGQVYKVRVDGPTDDLNSIGSYQLTLAASAVVSSPLANFSKATPFATSGGGTTVTPALGLITSSQQDNYYKFTTPASIANGVTVQVVDFGVGLTAPQLTVYNQLGFSIGQATASDSDNPATSVHFDGLLPNTTYYVKATDGLMNAYQSGSYQVSVSYAVASSTPLTVPILQTPWLGSIGAKLSAPNTSLKTAAHLQTPTGYSPGSFFTAMAGSDGSGTAQFYDVKSPAMSQPAYMTVVVQAVGSSSFLPWVGVTDTSGNAVPTQVLAQSGGTTVLQVPFSRSLDYVIKVAASTSNGGHSMGNYTLTTSFGTVGSGIATLASGMTAAAPAGTSTAGTSTSLVIPCTELQTFVLAGGAGNAATNAVLRMTITDSSGNVVASMTSPATEAASLNVLLMAGNYKVTVDAYSPSNSAIPTIYYTLTGTNLTDPMKVTLPTGGGGSPSMP